MTDQALRDIDVVGSSSTAASIGSVLSSFFLHPEWQGIAYMIARSRAYVASGTPTATMKAGSIIRYKKLL